MLNICHALINPQALSFVYLFLLSHKKMLSATDSHRHRTTKQFESQGKGLIGSFNVNISLSQQNLNWKRTESLLMQMKNVRCAWLCLAEQRAVGLPVMGDLLCLGVCLSVCQRVGGFMGPSPSVLLSQVPHLQRTREMN